jgi:AraC-like DNA-binding protein
MSTSRGVAFHYLEVALKNAKMNIQQAEPLLASVGLPASQLNDASLRLSDEQFVQVMLGLMKLTNDEFLGVGGRKRSPYGSFAMMTHCIIHLPTLHPALLRGIHFYRLFVPDLQIALNVKNGLATVTVDWENPNTDPHHNTIESILTVFQRLSSWLIDQRIPLNEANFSYSPPTHIDEYHMLFHCPLRFNQTHNSIVFDAVYLNYPIMQNEESLKYLLRNTMTSLFTPPKNTQLLTAQIRAMLGRDFTREMPEFDEIASRLALTPQTLRRRLKEENNSYQGIKDQMRRDAAIYYLSRAHLGIAEISQMMGFSEPSTFHRAFKKWTGMTPGEYRQGLHS